MEEHSLDFSDTEQVQLGQIEEKNLNFFDGLKSGISIAIGYIPIAIAFGLLAKSYNIPNYTSILMSLMVFAGASQFIAIQLIHLGSSPWEIVMTTFMLNFRHFLMSSSLSQRIAEGPAKRVLGFLAFGVTDETFAMASLRGERKLESSFIIGLNTISFLSWNAGTWIGIFAAGGLPEALKSSMGIALYAMFIALLIPSLKGSKAVFTIAIISIICNCILRWTPVLNSLSPGWTIIIATVISALIGAVVFPTEVEE